MIAPKTRINKKEWMGEKKMGILLANQTKLPFVSEEGEQGSDPKAPMMMMRMICHNQSTQKATSSSSSASLATLTV
mgnify:CR=1 FL=1